MLGLVTIVSRDEECECHVDLKAVVTLSIIVIIRDVTYLIQ